jgi:DNA adenine methylase
MIRPIYAGITPPLAHEPAERRKNIVVESSPFTVAAKPLQPISPVRPAAGYIGGKRNLSRRLVALIGSVPHELYAEAFVGMGGIFLRRESRPRSEVINDWSEDVATFFRILQRHYVAFMDMLRFQLTTRAGFERLMRTDPATLTDLERAARFLYLQRLAFGGKVAGRNFGVDPRSPARFDVTKLGPLLEAVHERLADVVIERLPWSDFLGRYDRSGTLFYLDPPYFGCEEDHGQGMFARSEFGRMADQLATLKGRFVLSLNDHPEVRKTFADFHLLEAETTYTVGGGEKAGRAAELIISNVEIGGSAFRSSRI